MSDDDRYDKFPRFSDPTVFATAPVNSPCVWIPGDAIPSCDFDPACPDHGTPSCPKGSDCHRVLGDD